MLSKPWYDGNLSLDQAAGVPQLLREPSERPYFKTIKYDID